MVRNKQFKFMVRQSESLNERFRKIVNHGGFIGVCLILFTGLPLIQLDQTIDPETAWRYTAFSFLLFLWLLVDVIKKPAQEQLLFHPAAGFMLGFLILGLLQLNKSVFPAEALIHHSRFFLMLVFLIKFSGLLTRDEEKRGKFVFFINIAVLIFSVFGLIQVGDFLSNESLRKSPFDPSVSLTSTLSNKNFYAETLFLFLPLVLYGCFGYRGFLRVLSVFSLMLILLSILLIYSVATWAAIFVFMVFILLTLPMLRLQSPGKYIGRITFRKSIVFLFFSIVFIVIMAMGVLTYKANYNSWKRKVETAAQYLSGRHSGLTEEEMKSNSFYDRLLLSRNSIRLWKENPWLGSGSGNWKILQARYGISGTEYLNMGILRFEHPHNDILFLLCETGIAGLLLWLATFLMAMKACFRLIRKDGNVKIRLLMCFIGAGLTGFLFLSVLSYPRERFFSMLLLMILFSIPFAFENRTIRVSGFLYRFFMLILLLSVTFVSYINLSRLKGEVLFKNALMHQQQGEMKAMYNDLLRCKANFFPVDETGTPLEWYLGLAAIYSRDTLLAESLFRRAVTLNPFHIQALNDLGSLLEKRLMYDEAENLYKRALAISPGNLRICVNLAISEFNAGDTLKAYNTLNAYPDHTGLSFREPFNRILYAMATAYVKSNRDTVLALFLNRQLSKNRLYLVTLHDSIGAGPLFLDKVSKAIGPE